MLDPPNCKEEAHQNHAHQCNGNFLVYPTSTQTNYKSEGVDDWSIFLTKETLSKELTKDWIKVA